MTAYETQTPFILHGLTESIRELCQLPVLKSLDSLLSTWSGTIDVHLDGIADEGNSTPLKSPDAHLQFKKGKSLLFNDANTVSPLLDQWVESIQKDLGVSRLTYGRSLIYATPSGHGTDPHFDQNINFVVQIHGQKDWWIAPNHHVKNPMSRHTLGLPTDPELSNYLDAPLPDQFPEDAVKHTLCAGSLLFLPRGMWHKTLAHSDALSLNFTYSAPTWIDLFTAALRAQLSLSEEWRETARVVEDFPNDPESLERFDTLLSGLMSDQENWKALDILGATE